MYKHSYLSRIAVYEDDIKTIIGEDDEFDSRLQFLLRLGINKKDARERNTWFNHALQIMDIEPNGTRNGFKIVRIHYDRHIELDGIARKGNTNFPYAKMLSSLLLKAMGDNDVISGYCFLNQLFYNSGICKEEYDLDKNNLDRLYKVIQHDMTDYNYDYHNLKYVMHTIVRTMRIHLKAGLQYLIKDDVISLEEAYLKKAKFTYTIPNDDEIEEFKRTYEWVSKNIKGYHSLFEELEIYKEVEAYMELKYGYSIYKVIYVYTTKAQLRDFMKRHDLRLESAYVSEARKIFKNRICTILHGQNEYDKLIYLFNYIINNETGIYHETSNYHNFFIDL